MKETLKVLMAQINPTVGAIEQNAVKIIQIIKEKQGTHDLIVFPELALTGYPPEDLILRKEFHQKVMNNLLRVQKEAKDSYILLGHPTLKDGNCYNSVSLLHQGQIIKVYHKQKLPNYDVFDENRYFIPGPKEPCIINIKDYSIGICICEDIWQEGPVQDLLNKKISILVTANASPFDYGKNQRRENLLKSYAKHGISIIYVNQICGQDELLFDGQSKAMDKNGNVCARAKAFEEDLCTVEIKDDQVSGLIAPLLNKEELVYKALITGTRDYVHKNKFTGVLLGLSGGIDSALTLCIAVDALGAENVHAVMMPSRYTAQISIDDSLELIDNLKVSYSDLSIEPAFDTLLTTLEPEFSKYPPNSSEENIQARIRGLLLMALSNKTGKMVLNTSNKSETAVGYSTLYGDMVGGFAVLKDVLKTEVYQLAHYRNSISNVIPNRIITRAPSAELRPNQTDQDSLPPYDVLDGILRAFIENDLSADEIIQLGYSIDDVNKVLRLLKHNEYKRRQAAPGIKISPTAFGKDWRYPISSGFKFEKE